MCMSSATFLIQNFLNISSNVCTNKTLKKGKLFVEKEKDLL